MITRTLSMTIEPRIDRSILTRRTKRLTVIPYDFRVPFGTRIITVSKRTYTILWVKCTSEDFIDKVMPSRLIAMSSILVVFRFSLSYHVSRIDCTRVDSVYTVGSGFVRDSMPGHDVVISRVLTGHSRGPDSKIEPYLRRSSVGCFVLAKDDTLNIWRHSGYM